MMYAKVDKTNRLVVAICNFGKKGTPKLTKREEGSYELIPCDDGLPPNMAHIDGVFVYVGEQPPHSAFINGEWVDTRSEAEKIASVQETIRSKRDVLLRGSDWTQLPDSPLAAKDKSSWVAYRQTLRDLPNMYSNETDINNVVFPTAP